MNTLSPMQWNIKKVEKCNNKKNSIFSCSFILAWIILYWYNARLPKNLNLLIKYLHTLTVRLKKMTGCAIGDRFKKLFNINKVPPNDSLITKSTWTQCIPVISLKNPNTSYKLWVTIILKLKSYSVNIKIKYVLFLFKYITCTHSG